MASDLLPLARLSVAAARGRIPELRARLAKALRAGVRPARIDEALLQVMPFAGFARAINALAALREFVPARSPRGPRDGFRPRGARLCRRIYGPVYGRLLERMKELHPVLPDWIQEIGYGQVLSRPVLSARERELLAVAVLAATPRVGPQLESHVRGALRTGASGKEIRSLLRGCGLATPKRPQGGVGGLRAPGQIRRDSRRDSPPIASRVPR